jgi:hypothetical protein
MSLHYTGVISNGSSSNDDDMHVSSDSQQTATDKAIQLNSAKRSNKRKHQSSASVVTSASITPVVRKARVKGIPVIPSEDLYLKIGTAGT